MFNRNIIRHLEQWKTKKHRKPLVLRGARQVGKTSAVKIFAEKNFDDLIYINLDKAEDFNLFKDVQSLAEFEKTADIGLGKKIIPGATLVFIDEIQNTPNLIELLRFFYEELGELHVIAAGSLLEVKIEKQGLEMPVGRVEYAYMYPLTFFEFLEAVGEKKLLEYLTSVSLQEKMIPSGIHNRALELFNDYSRIGGMPEAVSLYVQKGSQDDLNSLYASLLIAYTEDIYKYSSQADVKYIRHALEQSPYFAGERITYEKFGGSNFRSREMSEAFGVLEKAMIVNQIEATESRQLPIIAKKKRAKKLLYLDVGFVNFKNNIQAEYLNLKNLSDVYRGKIAEQIVGQNLITGNVYSQRQLHYWAKEKPEGSAEVDFCFSSGGSIFGIEVKSGHSARLKSLFSFADSVLKSKLIRIYGGSLKNEQITSGGKKYNLLSVPFYLVNRIFGIE